MKNLAKLVGIIAFVAIIGFSMTACDDGNGGGGDGGGNSALNGTWVTTVTGGQTQKMVLNNGNYTVSMDNVEMMKGTYSTSGSNMTMTITQVTGAAFGTQASEMGISASQWYTQQQLRATVIQVMVQAGMSQSEAEAMVDEMDLDGMFMSQTGTYSLSGNTLTITIEGYTAVFTRQ